MKKQSLVGHGAFRAWAGRALAIMGFVLGITATSVQAEPVADGPRSILITYRADAAQRPAFRRYLAHEEMARLADWKRQGVIADFQILFNPFNTEDTWDAMLVLRFDHYIDTTKWIKVERDNPGGLAPAGLALGKPVNTYSADVDWEDGAKGTAADRDALFYVIPYEYKNQAEYRAYFEGYVLPQVKGWVQAGVLTGYRIFMNRYSVGKPWDVLFVYRYKDLAAFGQRDATIANVRQQLKSDPEWLKWSQNKADIRTESENIITQAIEQDR